MRAAISSLLDSVRAALESQSDPSAAATAQRFFKESVTARGVAAPKIKRIAADAYREIKSWPVAQRNQFCTALWKSEFIEDGILATYIYRRFEKTCSEAEFRLFETWLDRYVNNWSHVDALAPHLIAACLAHHPPLFAELARWTQSPNRWMRRAAAVSLIQEAMQGRNLPVIFGTAKLLLADPDDIVQKGTGWLLKEAYPKSPAEVVAFLAAHPATPRLILRYAAEKMSPEHRRRVLA